MQTLIEVILPVFLVIGFGYFGTWKGWFSEGAVDGLMKFTQNFAIPCLLFKAISTLDLQATFDVRLLGSFYLGATTGFLAGLLGGRFLFGRPWTDAVAIGFCCLFSNSVILGLQITDRAYGAEAVEATYAIVALHAPFCYGLGMTVMEIVRNRGASPLQTARRVSAAMFRNALLIAIGLGIIVNLMRIPLPVVLTDAVALMARTALPAALFALGGVLVRYRPEGDLRVILYISAVSLILHPTVTWTAGTLTGLDKDSFRAAVLTSAMAPGVNTYVFANMYGSARRVAASSVLLATAGSIVTVWIWLMILP